TARWSTVSGNLTQKLCQLLRAQRGSATKTGTASQYRTAFAVAISSGQLREIDHPILRSAAKLARLQAEMDDAKGDAVSIKVRKTVLLRPAFNLAHRYHCPRLGKIPKSSAYRHISISGNAVSMPTSSIENMVSGFSDIWKWPP
ncbi:hypothetical protein, partial [Rhizobium binxianense]|uniref:hypothetical protein n=1 Tax=Rhizobium binxianense TaxID=3024242 RepID=UPI00234EA5BF